MVFCFLGGGSALSVGWVALGLVFFRLQLVPGGIVFLGQFQRPIFRDQICPIPLPSGGKRQKSHGLLFPKIRPTARPEGSTGGMAGSRGSRRASHRDRSRRGAYLPHKRRAQQQESPGLLSASSSDITVSDGVKIDRRRRASYFPKCAKPSAPQAMQAGGAGAAEVAGPLIATEVDGPIVSPEKSAPGGRSHRSSYRPGRRI